MKWPNFMFIENGNGKAANSTISVSTQGWSPPKAIIHFGFIFLNSLYFSLGMQFVGVAAETIVGWLVCCAVGIVQCLLNVLLYAIWR